MVDSAFMRLVSSGWWITAASVGCSKVDVKGAAYFCIGLCTATGCAISCDGRISVVCRGLIGQLNTV